MRATGTLEARTPGDQAVQVLLYVIIALVALACAALSSMWWSALCNRARADRASFFLIPQDVSLNAYQYIPSSRRCVPRTENSVIVTVIRHADQYVRLLHDRLPAVPPYLKGRNGFINMVIVTMLFTGGMVPAYIMVVNVLHLGNTYWAFGSTAMSAFNMIIIKNYFQGIPMELEEPPSLTAPTI